MHKRILNIFEDVTVVSELTLTFGIFNDSNKETGISKYDITDII